MKKLLLLTFSIAVVLCVFSQKKQTIATGNADSILFSKMKYRLVGPFRGGRSGAVCGDNRQKNTFYFGNTGGGVWKTNDGGSNWKNISDKYFGGSIGSVSIAPSDNTVLYVGEGESTLRGNVSEGSGIWRSRIWSRQCQMTAGSGATTRHSNSLYAVLSGSGLRQAY